jgi:hypothetical protein
VDDQPHVFLVNAHPEGVRCADYLEFSGQKLMLDALFLRRRQPRMKVRRVPTFGSQVLGRRLGCSTKGMEHDGATLAPVRQAVAKHVVHPLQFAMARDCLDLETQIRSIDAAFEQRQLAPCFRF